jgi:hypothetical protein
MVVKLVSTDGNELPFKGFVLIPEDRLAPLERIAAAARDLVARQKEAVHNVSRLGDVEPALKTLGQRVGELEKVWDIPQTAPHA